MLLGEFNPKLDEKNRLILPAKLRADFADGMVLTRGQEKCVYAFPPKEFQELYDKVRQAPVSSKQARNYLRLFLSGASDEAMDKQNRVTIPQTLRDYAGLDRELAVVGLGTRIEIWDAEAWKAFVSEEEDNYSAIEEEVIPGLI
ncbi:MAG: division/cell wall cluster transcriptional repressor MraZ [Microbacteriaceae bacterium]